MYVCFLTNLVREYMKNKVKTCENVKVLVVEFRGEFEIIDYFVFPKSP